MAGHASGAERNPVGFGYRSSVARAAEKISTVPDLATAVSSSGCGKVREGKLERILHELAEELQARGKLQLEEAFIDASFTGAKKGPRGRAHQARQRDESYRSRR